MAMLVRFATIILLCCRHRCCRLCCFIGPLHWHRLITGLVAADMTRHSSLPETPRGLLHDDGQFRKNSILDTLSNRFVLSYFPLGSVWLRCGLSSSMHLVIHIGLPLEAGSRLHALRRLGLVAHHVLGACSLAYKQL